MEKFFPPVCSYPLRTTTLEDGTCVTDSPKAWPGLSGSGPTREEATAAFNEKCRAIVAAHTEGGPEAAGETLSRYISAQG